MSTARATILAVIEVPLPTGIGGKLLSVGKRVVLRFRDRTDDRNDDRSRPDGQTLLEAVEAGLRPAT